MSATTTSASKLYVGAGEPKDFSLPDGDDKHFVTRVVRSA
jgi:hypothetical protein